MTAVAESHDDLEAEHEEEYAHFTDGQFWKVGGFLAVLTALEVSTYFWPHGWHKVTDALLIIMMTIKFGTVALYFMHLKFDDRLLRRVFFAGLTLALAVYLVALSAFFFWHHSGTQKYDDPPLSRVKPPPPTTPS